MLEKKNHQNYAVIDLTKNVLVNTAIPKANHAALRAGFAGYPPNPQWTTSKYLAWKTGSKWRKALANGEMTVRSQDGMLVPLNNKQDSPKNKLARGKYAQFYRNFRQSAETLAAKLGR